MSHKSAHGPDIWKARGTGLVLTKSSLAYAMKRLPVVGGQGMEVNELVNIINRQTIIYTSVDFLIHSNIYHVAMFSN